MLIELLSKTDDRVAAWAHSRPNNPEAKDISIQELNSMNFSLHGLARYTFKVESTRLFLDLVTTVTKECWSQSSRITPVKDMILDMESDKCQKILDKAKTLDLPQDLQRLYTPLYTKIGFTFSMNHRTLIGFLKSLKIFRFREYIKYGHPILDAIGWTSDKLDQSPIGPVIHDIRDILFSKKEESINETATHIEIIGDEKYNILSQFQRHIGMDIVSNIWFMSDDEIQELMMIDKIRYHMLVDKYQFKKNILSHRSCWLADFNHWGPIIEKYLPEAKLKDLTPCHCDPSRCTYVNDNLNRIQGTDPNYPCPIYSNNNCFIHKRYNEEGPNHLINLYKDEL